MDGDERVAMRVGKRERQERDHAMPYHVLLK